MEISGNLPMGIEYAGKVHTEFSLRPARVKDTITALEESGGDNAKLALARLSKQIVRLGDIPAESITTELLMEAYEADLEALEKAQDTIEKKARGIADPIAATPMPTSPAS